jgi:hypothetical protein
MCHPKSIEAHGYSLASRQIVPSMVVIRKGFPELCLKDNRSPGVMGVAMHLVGGQARRSWIHRRLSGGIKTYA